MPRDRFGDDDRDDNRPPPRPSTNPALVLILVLGGAVLVGLLVCAGAVALFWTRAEVAPAPPAVESGPPVVVEGPAVEDGTKRVYARDDFRAAVLGKSRDEVTAAVGKPAGAGEDRLVYKERTRDPMTGKLDPVTVVRFKDGKAIAVDY